MSAGPGGTQGLRVGVTPWRSGSATGDDGELIVLQAEFAEQVGCHSFWLPESHFVDDARPAPLLELAHVAARTRTLRLGTTSLLLPIRHPILLAEEVATLDRLSGGRLILGIGRGFRKPLFRAMGIEPSEKRTLLEHGLQTMRRLWSGGPVTALASSVEVEHAGPDLEAAAVESNASLDRLTLVPQPLQDGGPPIWMAAFGPKALGQAARLQLPYLASPLEGEAQLRSNYDFLERRAAELDVPPIARRPVMRTVFVHEDAAVRRSVIEALGIESESWKRRAAPVLRRTLEEPLQDRVLVGSAEAVGSRLARLRGELGVTDVIVRASIPGAATEAIEASIRATVELAGNL